MEVAGGLWSAAIHRRFGLRTKRSSLLLQPKAAMNSRTPKHCGSLLEPVSSSLNEEAARKILALKADRKAQAPITKLAD